MAGFVGRCSVGRLVGWVVGREYYMYGSLSLVGSTWCCSCRKKTQPFRISPWGFGFDCLPSCSFCLNRVYACPRVKPREADSGNLGIMAASLSNLGDGRGTESFVSGYGIWNGLRQSIRERVGMAALFEFVFGLALRGVRGREHAGKGKKTTPPCVWFVYIHIVCCCPVCCFCLIVAGLMMVLPRFGDRNGSICIVHHIIVIVIVIVEKRLLSVW
jgi:hypothetical protein